VRRCQAVAKRAAGGTCTSALRPSGSRISTRSRRAPGRSRPPDSARRVEGVFGLAVAGRGHRDQAIDRLPPPSQRPRDFRACDRGGRAQVREQRVTLARGFVQEGLRAARAQRLDVGQDLLLGLVPESLDVADAAGAGSRFPGRRGWRCRGRGAGSPPSRYSAPGSARRSGWQPLARSWSSWGLRPVWNSSPIVEGQRAADAGDGGETALADEGAEVFGHSLERPRPPLVGRGP
jgi:hypothetical protein